MADDIPDVSDSEPTCGRCGLSLDTRHEGGRCWVELHGEAASAWVAGMRADGLLLAEGGQPDADDELLADTPEPEDRDVPAELHEPAVDDHLYERSPVEPADDELLARADDWLDTPGIIPGRNAVSERIVRDLASALRRQKTETKRAWSAERRASEDGSHWFNLRAAAERRAAGLERELAGDRPETTVGPCGDPAEVPAVEVRRVGTDDGPKVEIALRSPAYCWRVRSWWTPPNAQAIANEIAVAAGDRPVPPTRQQVRRVLINAMVTGTGDQDWADSIYVRSATDAVMALLRGVPTEPEETT